MGRVLDEPGCAARGKAGLGLLAGSIEFPQAIEEQENRSFVFLAKGGCFWYKVALHLAGTPQTRGVLRVYRLFPMWEREDHGKSMSGYG